MSIDIVKKVLRGLVLSIPSPFGVPLSKLRNDYHQLEGGAIPFADFGFRNELDFLYSMHDCIRIHKEDGRYYARAVLTHDNAHIAQLVRTQRKFREKRVGNLKRPSARLAQSSTQGYHNATQSDHTHINKVPIFNSWNSQTGRYERSASVSTHKQPFREPEKVNVQHTSRLNCLSPLPTPKRVTSTSHRPSCNDASNDWNGHQQQTHSETHSRSTKQTRGTVKSSNPFIKYSNKDVEEIHPLASPSAHKVPSGAAVDGWFVPEQNEAYTSNDNLFEDSWRNSDEEDTPLNICSPHHEFNYFINSSPNVSHQKPSLKEKFNVHNFITTSENEEEMPMASNMTADEPEQLVYPFTNPFLPDLIEKYRNIELNFHGKLDDDTCSSNDETDVNAPPSIFYPQLNEQKQNNMTSTSPKSNEPNIQDHYDSSEDSDSCREALPDLAENHPVFYLKRVPLVPFGAKFTKGKIPTQLSPGCIFKLFISEVNNPYKFWFHFEEYGDGLENLMGNMQLYYNEETRDLNFTDAFLKIGHICAAKWFGRWHRAIIVKVYKPSNQAKVFYVDYGTTDDVDVKDIRLLANDFFHLPTQAFRGCLDFIHPICNSVWSHDCTKKLIDIVADKPMYGWLTHVNNNTATVFMKLSSTTHLDDLQVGTLLTINGFARELESSIVDWPVEPYSVMYPTFDMLENGVYPSFEEVQYLVKMGVEVQPCEGSIIFVDRYGYSWDKQCHEAKINNDLKT